MNKTFRLLLAQAVLIAAGASAVGSASAAEVVVIAPPLRRRCATKPCRRRARALCGITVTGAGITAAMCGSPGHWQPERVGYHWVPGHWVAHGPNYRWVEGHWA